MPKGERVRGQPQSAWSAPPVREPLEDYQSFGRSAPTTGIIAFFAFPLQTQRPGRRSPSGYQSAMGETQEEWQNDSGSKTFCASLTSGQETASPL